MSLEETLGLAHGGLEIKRLDVLPVLLKQRDQKVDGKHNVGNELIFSHLDVTNSDTQAKNLLKLELDGGTNVISLGLQVIIVGDSSRELADLVKTRTQKTRNLLDQSIRSQESIITLSKLLDKLLVLVKLLQILNRLEFHTSSLGLVTVESITKNTDGEVGTRNVGKPKGCIGLFTAFYCHSSH